MEEFSLSQGEKTVTSSFRGLVGWMNDTDATKFHLGRLPAPTDDLTHIQPIIAAHQAAVNTRPVWKSSNPIREIDHGLAKAIKARPDLQGAFGSLQWAPALVDLREVLSYQQLIHLDGLEDRVAPVSDTLEDLVKFCLPVYEPLSQLGAFVDDDKKGYTLSSLNPNLHILEGVMHDTEVARGPGLPSMRVKAVTFFIGLGSSYLNVGRYRGRCFLRDGYHRAAGLLKKGIHVVPCIVVDARNTDELGLKQGLFTYEVIYGDRPPRLADFWDDTVAYDGKGVAIRRVLRIRGEEFNVQR